MQLVVLIFGQNSHSIFCLKKECQIAFTDLIISVASGVPFIFRTWMCVLMNTLSNFCSLNWQRWHSQGKTAQTTLAHIKYFLTNLSYIAHFNQDKHHFKKVDCVKMVFRCFDSVQHVARKNYLPTNKSVSVNHLVEEVQSFCWNTQTVLFMFNLSYTLFFPVWQLSNVEA